MKKTEIYISKSRPRIFEFFFCFFDETGKNLLCPILCEKCKIDFIYSKSSIKPSTHLSSPFQGRKVNKPPPPPSLLSLAPSPPLYSQMIDCILINHDCNTSRAVRFIHVLEVRICFWSSCVWPSCDWAFSLCALDFMENWYQHPR